MDGMPSATAPPDGQGKRDGFLILVDNPLAAD